MNVQQQQPVTSAYPQQGNFAEEKQLHPNHNVYRKMERLISLMLNVDDGVPIKTVKSFLSKIPSVFTGQDLVGWLLQNVDIADLGDALHLAHLLASHGYVFQIDDHVLTVKNDNTYYRFQTPYFWPSNCWEPENTDYAVYLCKRTMQNKAHLELEDFEAENLAKLQKMFSRKWEFVFMQAEAQYKVDKKRDRMERQILDSQERAFWDLHRPVPGCVNTTELSAFYKGSSAGAATDRSVDFRKLSRSGRPKYSASTSLLAQAAAASSSCSTTSNGPAAAAQPTPTKTTTAKTVPTRTADECSSTACTSSASCAGGGDVASTSVGGAEAPAPNRTTANAASSSSVREVKYHQRPGFRRQTRLQDSIKTEITDLHNRLAKNVLRTSKVVENYLQYYDHRILFDAFLVQLGSATDPFHGQPNPWISDTVDFWDHDKMYADVSARRLKLWEESLEELLTDPLGRETLQKFLDKEYSGENLRFWMEVQRLRKCSCRFVPVLVTEIYNEFIDANATSPVNIDCKVMEITEENLRNNPNRWSFDDAADHIFCLMKNDSYQRFLRSEMYREMVNTSKKKSSLSTMNSRKASRKVPSTTRVILPNRFICSSASAYVSASVAAQPPYPYTATATLLNVSSAGGARTLSACNFRSGSTERDGDASPATIILAGGRSKSSSGGGGINAVVKCAASANSNCSFGTATTSVVVTTHQRHHSPSTGGDDRRRDSPSLSKSRTSGDCDRRRDSSFSSPPLWPQLPQRSSSQHNNDDAGGKSAVR
ncbi:hypothetical protein niasHT_002610 [Heterodera trifolii]|uniref:Regulator of G-protein signaling 7 n=1 Tax=Heterodera trifolii TaxID=157864 RepID=A0ABD2M0G5_9BILA